MSPTFPVSSASGLGLTLAIAIILLASNFTIINAQPQQLTSQPTQFENGTTAAAATIFQSVNDSFSIQVPNGWITHDINNSASALSEETRLGYGLLAQLCSQEEQQQGAGAFSTNASESTSNNMDSNNNCQGDQEEIIHIIRYPDLGTRLPTNNVTTTNNNMTTTDNIVSYQLQKLQEVGYRSMRIITSTDLAVNLTNPQTNERIATLPAKLVEMTYGTNFSPNEIRRGYLISTATNATAPNLGVTKGYAVFYEGNSTTTNAAAAITSIPDSLPPSTLVGQVLGSFELIVSPEMAQSPAQQASAQSDEVTQDAADDDDDNGGDDDDDNGGDDGCENIGGTSCADDYG
ncbi:MAG TPA: hypothetical protein VIP53_00510 [Nitrososphaera sp.]